MKRVWRRIRNRFRHSNERERTGNNHSVEIDSEGGGVISNVEFYRLLDLLVRLDSEREKQQRGVTRLESPLPPAIVPTQEQSDKQSTTVKIEGGQTNKTTQSSSNTDPEKEMVKELSCPVCGWLFIDPVISPCLHSLCSQCADSLLSRNKFPCPVCKEVVTRERLKKNYPLNNTVEVFKRKIEARRRREDIENSDEAHIQSNPLEEHSESASGQKDVVEKEKLNIASLIADGKQCDLCGKPPDLHCVHCSLSFCSHCLIDYHPTLESTPDHCLVGIGVYTNQCDVQEARL